VWILPGREPWANMGRMSGDPNENVVLDWLKTESKSTGFVFHPSKRSLVTPSNDDLGMNHLGDSRYILVHST